MYRVWQGAHRHIHLQRAHFCAPAWDKTKKPSLFPSPFKSDATRQLPGGGAFLFFLYKLLTTGYGLRVVRHVLAHLLKEPRGGFLSAKPKGKSQGNGERHHDARKERPRKEIGNAQL